MTQPDNTELVQRWRSLFKRYNTPELAGQEKATILRDMLTEIEYHRKLGRISEPCYDALNKKYTKEYARITQFKKENTAPPVEEETHELPEETKEPSESSSVRETYPEVETQSAKRSKSDNAPSPFPDNEPVTSHSSFTIANSHRTGTPNVEVETDPEVVIEKVRKLEIPTKPKADQSLLNLWACARKSETKDSYLISRPDKRKHVSDSPVSKKSSKSELTEKVTNSCDFLTAAEQLRINQMKKNGGRPPFKPEPVIADSDSLPQYGKAQKSLGTRRGLSSKFVPPIPNNSNSNTDGQACTKPVLQDEQYTDPIYQDERLKNCQPRMIELILNEILDNGQPLSWDDIAGLEFAKKTIQEIVVWPMLRPDIFTGLRGPPKGLLLFGPPGTGKTLIGKCIASQSNSTFFTISASSLTSKWIGEGEKMVRTLFAVARCQQPAVIFIDEIDSLLSQRSESEHESSRRIKTEFLVQLDGACTSSEDRLLVIGATNRPQEIDEAARRRFVKRLYIPLPETNARRQIVQNLLQDQKSELTDSHLDEIGQKTDGFSGSDVANLCREAALGPIRSIPFGEIHNIAAEDVRSIQYCDFVEALDQVKASVSDKDLNLYVEWNNKFGSGKR